MSTTLKSGVITSEANRRKELAGFVKAKRTSLTPAQLGLPDTSRRRRVKGLRREELAEAAGISVAWLSWMEQARDIQISEATLDRLSRALLLDDAERTHLFRSAGHAVPPPSGEQSGQALSCIQDLLDSMEPNPSYAMNALWDIVAWNNSATAVIHDFTKMADRERNFVRLVFASHQFRQTYLNWEDVALCTLAHFRTDSIDHTADIRWLSIVEDMTRKSEEFRKWWPRHNVVWPSSSLKDLDHPTMGRLLFNSLDLELQRPARLRIVTYIPVRGER